MISICIIATNKYKEFVPQLVFSIEQYFLPYHDKEVNLFVDTEWPIADGGRKVKIIQHRIPPYTFPDATLKRFEIMTSVPKEDYGDYIFYLDADMLCVDFIGEEILNDITVVAHPGYFNNPHNKGTWETRAESTCYVKSEKRIVYVAGGFNGGATNSFYAIMQIMKGWIDKDISNGIKPIWDDESALNKLISFSDIGKVKYLTPEYCCPEPVSKRIAWGINHFTPKILALEKPKNFRD